MPTTISFNIAIIVFFILIFAFAVFFLYGLFIVQIAQHFKSKYLTMLGFKNFGEAEETIEAMSGKQLFENSSKDFSAIINILITISILIVMDMLFISFEIFLNYLSGNLLVN